MHARWGWTLMASAWLGLGLLGQPRLGAVERPMTIDGEHPAPVQVVGIGPWVVYDDRRPDLAVTFEYPGNWVVGVEEGRPEQPYWQVLILGPRNADNSFSVGLTIRRLPTTAPGRLYADLPSLIAGRRAQFGANRSFVLGHEAERELLDSSAWESDFSYVVPLPLHSVHAKPTTIQTRLVQFAVGTDLYELSLSADANEFPAHQPVFEHLLESLRRRER